MSVAGFLLDVHRCVGCGACVLACRLENGWSTENPWRRVLPLNIRRHPGGPTYFLSVACHHCDEPACQQACPSAAYEKRTDGIVLHREARCLGCRYCEMACPFGAPRYDEVAGIVGKCDFCQTRGDTGRPPACVAACPTEALRLLPDDASGEALQVVPGFVDTARCAPRIRFRKPRGERRASLVGAIEDAIAGRAAGPVARRED
jgi:Fe-S-cluster-containing dehydrogenase component